MGEVHKGLVDHRVLKQLESKFEQVLRYEIKLLNKME